MPRQDTMITVAIQIECVYDHLADSLCFLHWLTLRASHCRKQQQRRDRHDLFQPAR